MLISLQSASIGIALMLSLSGGLASAVPIKVLVLDAHSGHPAKATDVTLTISGNNARHWYKTDQNGIVTIDIDPAEKLIPDTGRRITCHEIDASNPHWISVSTIVEQGVVEQNTCGESHALPVKGTLTIFARKTNLLEKTSR